MVGTFFVSITFDFSGISLAGCVGISVMIIVLVSITFVVESFSTFSIVDIFSLCVDWETIGKIGLVANDDEEDAESDAPSEDEFVEEVEPEECNKTSLLFSFESECCNEE